MGARIECQHGFLPPLRVEGADLRGIDYELPVPSAQVKSCLLLAGLLAEGETSLVEPEPSRDHTERMLKRTGAPIDVADGRVSVRGVDGIEPPSLEIHGDFSSAAFFLVAALLVPGSELRLPGVGINPTRTGLLAIAGRMGADIEVLARDEIDGEPVAELVARHSSLGPTEVTNTEVPLTIDELPLVGLLGCFAKGETVVMGAAELRNKESDRLAGVVDALSDLGGEIESRRDGFIVHGAGGLQGGWLDSKGDHRLAMLGAIAGLASREGVTVEGMNAAAVSYPAFEADLKALLS
jgi:3-phosphoshikimate 1-carboxyvinyltransferase